VTKLTGSEVLTKTQIRNFQERASFESKIHKKIQKLPLLRIRIAFDGLKAVKEDLRGELGPLSFCVIVLVGMREVRNEDGTKTVHSLLLSSLP